MHAARLEARGPIRSPALGLDLDSLCEAQATNQLQGRRQRED